MYLFLFYGKTKISKNFILILNIYNLLHIDKFTTKLKIFSLLVIIFND